MGKMDTGNLSERYFDENTILYSASDRNEIVFGDKDKEAEQKAETATVTKQADASEDAHVQNENDASTDASVADSSDEQALIDLWRRYKESNPEGTLDGFYQSVLTANSEVQ
jgi:predicted metal-dependent hydrolase